MSLVWLFPPRLVFTHVYRIHYAQSVVDLQVNMLAQELFKMSGHQAARQKQFEMETRPSDDQVARYKTLVKADRLVATSWYRTSMSSLLKGDGRRLFCVFQREQDYPRPPKKPAAVLNEEVELSEYLLETFQQPASGWIVDVNASTCQCRTWYKFGYCVHLIAARVYAGLTVEGVTKKRKFANKSSRRGAKGTKVGHALTKE
jgi:hypothetical protein